MNYFIERNQQQFGPYTVPQLQTYVASGSVLLTDIARDAQTGVATSVATLLVQPAGMPTLPLPPNLHWAIVFLISFVFSPFATIWQIIQMMWIKKIDAQSKASLYFVIGLGGFLLLLVVGLVVLLHDPNNPNPWGGLPIFLGVVCLLVFVVMSFFDMRRSMLAYYNTVEPIQLRLSGIMTFFFNLYYLQYHMSRIATWKQTGYLSPQS